MIRIRSDFVNMPALHKRLIELTFERPLEFYDDLAPALSAQPN